jgi:hypothetical protein
MQTPISETFESRSVRTTVPPFPRQCCVGCTRNVEQEVMVLSLNRLFWNLEVFRKLARISSCEIL